MKRPSLTWLVAILVGCTGPAFGAKDTAVTRAALQAQPMPQSQIYKLYSNKTWDWGRNGAGYFAAKRREFRAATRAGFGEGAWFIPRDGKLCFRAAWVDKASTSKTLTCFEHRTQSGIIYQRRLPTGDWYVFKHNKTRAGDEYRKLKNGDAVRRRFGSAKARLKP